MLISLRINKSIIALSLICLSGYAYAVDAYTMASSSTNNEVNLVETAVNTLLYKVKSNFPSTISGYEPQVYNSSYIISPNDNNKTLGDYHIKRVTIGFAPLNTICDTTNPTARAESNFVENEGSSTTSGFTKCLVNYSNTCTLAQCSDCQCDCDHDYSDLFLVEVQISDDLSNIALSGKNLIFVAKSPSLTAIKRQDIISRDPSAGTMGSIQYFDCVNVKGTAGDQLNSGTRMGEAADINIAQNYQSTSGGLGFNLCFSNWASCSTCGTSSCS